jgi:uncharacterized membrane protein
MEAKASILSRIYHFYLDGFRSMTLGKTLWLIIFIKLFIMFFVLKLFFFKDHLSQNTQNEHEKPAFVLDHLTQ